MDIVVVSVITETRDPPEPIVKDDGARVAVRPTDPVGIVALRATVPLKPRLSMVTVDVADSPAVKLAGDGAV